MLLSDEEISEISLSAVTVKDAVADVRAVEDAILAKLAAKELPKPVCWSVESSKKGTPLFGKGWMFSLVEHLDAKFPLFTDDQLRQAYSQGFAAGAAAQISRLGEKDGPNT